MCQRAVCRSCRKVTYEGCGRHVEQVLAGVPTPQRCMCESVERKRARTGEVMTRSGPVLVRPGGSARHTPVPRRPDSSRGQSRGGWWARLVAWAKSPA